MAASRNKWVTCDDHTAGPYATTEQAERQIADTEKLGRCKLDHKVTEAQAKPEPEWKKRLGLV